jgi:hypothetical protein
MQYDEGHDNLISDLQGILSEAKNFEFHDFKNSKHPAPKMALAELLDKIRGKVINGDYDN